MLKRRSFLIACGSIATVSSFSTASPPHAENALSPLPSVDPAVETLGQPNNLLYRIDGWDLSEESEATSDDLIWIQLNSSWRSAWR